MTNRFDEALDDCLTRVVLYGESVEACLQRYPDYAAELREQLEVARIAQEAYRPRALAKGTSAQICRGRPAPTRRTARR